MLAYTVVVSSIAVIIGLVLVNLFRPGDGVDPVLAQRLLAEGSARAQEIVVRQRQQRLRHATCSCRSCRRTWSRPPPTATCWR